MTPADRELLLRVAEAIERVRHMLHAIDARLLVMEREREREASGWSARG